MSLDLSPVRPWEWGDIDAYEWTLTRDVQAALKSGFADHQAIREDVAKADDLRKNLIAKHLGKTG